MTAPRNGALAHAAMREHHQWSRREPLCVGMAVTAAVRNLREAETDGVTASTKYRPAIIVVQRDGESWGVIGLTTNATYSDGKPRLPIPAWQSFLREQGFIWSTRIAFVPPVDIRSVLGTAPPELLRYLIRTVGLSPDEKAALVHLVLESS